MYLLFSQLLEFLSVRPNFIRYRFEELSIMNPLRFWEPLKVPFIRQEQKLKVCERMGKTFLNILLKFNALSLQTYLSLCSWRRVRPELHDHCFLSLSARVSHIKALLQLFVCWRNLLLFCFAWLIRLFKKCVGCLLASLIDFLNFEHKSSLSTVFYRNIRVLIQKVL